MKNKLVLAFAGIGAMPPRNLLLDPTASTEGAQQLITSIKSDVAGFKKTADDLAADYKTLRAELTEAQTQLKDARKQLLARSSHGLNATRTKGKVSQRAAMALGAQFVLHCAKSGKLDALAPAEVIREKLFQESRSFYGLEVKAALTTTDVPLPVEYFGDLMELIEEFGVARQNLTMFPLGGGTSRPPRMGTRPAFGSLTISTTIPEKSPTLTFASLEPHKIGGIVVVPREIDDQSIVPIGQYLARYGAVEFARAEDTWAFLADGSNTYESVVGICKTARDNNKYIQLGSTKTAASDITKENIRKLRSKVNSAALANGKYYLNHTMEVHLRTMNEEKDPFFFVYRPDGTATIDGFEVVWTNVLAPYSTDANAAAYVAAFGDARFWWMGQRTAPRIDTSEHVYFQYDQLATRFIEEIDFDYNSVEAMAALQLAAS